MSGFLVDAYRHRLATCLLAVTALCACGTELETALDSEAKSERTAAAHAGRMAALPSFGALAERTGPAVVSVVVTRTLSDELELLGPEFQDDPLFHFFRRLVPQTPEGEAPEFRSQGLGSGFIISPDGYILTSAHLVAGSAGVIVRLPDTEREFPAQVVGIDRRTDVGLLKIDAHNLRVVKLGASKALRAGDWVAAIGSPFGFSSTITAGIVGATRRTLPIESLVPFIQTDVAVNPGNSGGPLLNLEGEVVGINSIIYSRTGGYMGMSFAVPIEVALEVSEQLRQQGYVTRGHIGVQIQALTEKLAHSFRTPSIQGVLIAAVEPGGPAARVGLQAGDVMLEYGGIAVESVEEALQLIAKSKPGTQAALGVWRNGDRKHLSVTVDELPAEKLTPAPSARRSTGNQLRLVVTEIPVTQRRQLRVEYGLVVESVQGRAEDSGLELGDIIVALNQTPLTSREQFDELLSGQEPGNTVALRVFRGLSPVYVPMKIPG